MDKKRIEKIKLLAVLTYYYPHWTGLSQYAKNLSEGLDKEKFVVRVLTTQHDPTLARCEVYGGVTITRVPVLLRISRTLLSIQMFFSLLKEIYETDRVVVFLPFAEVWWVTVVCALLGKPYWLIHNGDLVLPKGWVNRILEFLFFSTTAWAIRWSQGIIVNTSDYARNSPLLKRFRNKWIELRPPFPDTQNSAQRKNPLKQQLPQGFKVAGFSGRFVEEKGFDILLKSIPLVLKKDPRVVFVFAGETNIPYEDFFGKQKEALYNAKKNLILLGRLSRKEMPSFYEICNILIVSSRSDFFPFVQAEALRSGVPVVVTNIPGARMPVSETGMGVIVDKENPEALAEGIVKALTDEKKLVGRHSKVLGYFDYHSTMLQYERLFGQGK